MHDRSSAHADGQAQLSHLFLAALLGLGLGFAGCSKDEIANPPQEPSLSDLTAPTLVSPAQVYAVRVRASDPQGVRTIRYVLLEIYRVDGSEPVARDTLWDDGAYLHRDDGDVVAGDGIFSQRLVWQWSGPEEQTYRLVFVAVDQDGNRSEPLEREVRARRNDAPVIVQLEVPAVLPSGLAGDFRFRALVADSQGLGDVAAVRFAGLRGSSVAFEGQLFDDGTHGDAEANDGWFELGLPASFGASKQGPYTLRFWAEDRLGLSSQVEERSVVIENEPPAIIQVSLPDSVAKPTTGSVLVRITASVYDPQTLLDVKRVGFTSLKPDSTYANNGLPIPMADNGLPFDPMQYPSPFYGDEVAGDGVYTFTMVVYSDEQAAQNGLPPVQKGTYRFTFQAFDWVEQASEPVQKTFVVY